jgi:dTMP kinase
VGGKLIVFEGVEGCGKTTQLHRTRDWLLSRMKDEIQSQVPVVLTREPGGTELGLSLRQLLLEGHHQIQERAELLLYAADRAQHFEKLLKPHLEQGAIVLCDRYTDSTVAYQGYGRGLSLTLIDQLNQIATDGLESCITLWLDIDVKIGLSRVRQRGISDRMEQADMEFHQRVQQGYIELAKAHSKRIARIDASGSQEEVQQQIQRILVQSLNMK